ncbi:serine hydrolase [Gilvibacter sp.]|uniref:serine hydrolase n=1 Tax=Gilvibacter sp. TaxID=2729997 RepID=UPI003F4A0370
MFLRLALISLSLFTLFSCQKEAVDPLKAALSADDPAIKKVMNNLEAHEVQIALSVVDYSASSLAFKEYEFQVNDSVYFYPASTVKFPMAVITLEQLDDNGFINLDATITVNGDSISSSFRKDIRDIFAVSSNEAYNRLYEYLGNDFVNDRMYEVGLNNFRLAHRLSTPNAADPMTKGLIFQGSGEDELFEGEGYQMQPLKPLNLQKINKGVGYYKNDTLVNEPMSFALKNYYPISSMHGTMKRVIFPEYFSTDEQFKLSAELHQFLMESMQLLPHEAGYAKPEYYDSYVKFFMFGDNKADMPEDISILNKVGYAYGYLTDCAYILDHTNEIAFILTATVHVNENGIYNDNNYQYDETGIPFLAALGRQIHQQLLNTKQ